MGLFDFSDIESQLTNFDSGKFTDELIADAAISDEEKAILRKITSDPKVAGKLKNSVALRSAAQSALDRTRKVASEAERVRDENFKWADENRAALEQWVAEKRGGTTRITAPSGESYSRAEVEKILDAREAKLKDDFNKTLQQQDEAYVGLMADSIGLMQEYSKTFDGEPLPYEELQKFAIAKRMSMRNAFPLFIGPKLAEKQKVEFDKKLEEAREEGRRQALTERENPEHGESGGGELGSAFKDSLLGRRTQKVTGADGKQLEGEDAFVANWAKNNAFVKSSH